IPHVDLPKRRVNDRGRAPAKRLHAVSDPLGLAVTPSVGGIMTGPARQQPSCRKPRVEEEPLSQAGLGGAVGIVARERNCGGATKLRLQLRQRNRALWQNLCSARDPNRYGSNTCRRESRNDRSGDRCSQSEGQQNAKDDHPDRAPLSVALEDTVG